VGLQGPEGPQDALARLRAAGVLDAVDAHFARAVVRLAAGGIGEVAGSREREASPENPALDVGRALALGAALCSQQRSVGHVCVELSRWADTPIQGAEGEAVPGWRWPSQPGWEQVLCASVAVEDRKSVV